MNNRKSFYITRTAVFLALALAIQFTLLKLFAGNPVTTYIVGSLLNMIFFTAAVTIGLWSGVMIGVMTPIVAFLTGHLPFAVLIPFVIAANLVLVVIYYGGKVLFKDKLIPLTISGVIAGTVKFLFMFLAAKFILPLISSIPAPAVTKLAAGWSIPQFVTAMIGLALSVMLRQSLKKTNVLEK
ncbi:MAG: hypothetical protein ACOX3U_00660 [Christensenellales bacterium]|jgi:uncharacterized membrane protein